MNGLVLAMLIINTLAVLVLGYLLLRKSASKDAQPEKVKAKAPTPPEPDLSDLAPEAARAIDTDHPPYYSYYRPEVYDPHRAPSCTCHGLKVLQGEKVLLWPIPNHPEGGYDVFCAQTYGKDIED